MLSISGIPFFSSPLALIDLFLVSIIPMCKWYKAVIMPHEVSLVFLPQVSEESAESWVDEFTTSGPDFQQAKAAVEVLERTCNL